MQTDTRTACFAGALALAASVVAAQPPTFNGPEFQVNTYTHFYQTYPDVAADPSGHYIVVWEGTGPEDTWGIFGRRYRSSGVPLGPQFVVNSITVDYQYAPKVAADGAGNFVVTWQSYGDGDGWGIMARRFGPDGTPIGGQFQVNTYTLYSQYAPVVAVDDDGDFVVAWNSYETDGNYFGIAAQRFNSSGTPIGSEFVVNTFTVGDQYYPDVAIFGNGNFVVTWNGTGAGDSDGVFGRRFDSMGVAMGGEFPINTTTAGSQKRPSVAGNADGSFVVVWESYEAGDVFGRRFDTSGAGGSEGEGWLDSAMPEIAGYAGVAVDEDGDFVVTWTNFASVDGDGAGVAALGFDFDTDPVIDRFRVNTYTTGNQFLASVAGSGDGDFQLVWSGGGAQDGDGTGVFGQAIGDLVFSDGGESGSAVFWSSVQPGITTTAAAALGGSDFGFQAQVSGLGGVFLQDDAPEDEDRYRARFYIDPNGHDPGESLNQRRVRVLVLFEEGPNRRLAAVVLRRLTGQFALSGRVRLDDNSQANTPFFNISDAGHWVEIDWQRSRGPDANNGSFALTIDGTPVSTLTLLDNSISSVDMVRMGTISNKSAANGQVFVDEFVSRRANPIGPVN